MYTKLMKKKKKELCTAIILKHKRFVPLRTNIFLIYDDCSHHKLPLTIDRSLSTQLTKLNSYFATNDRYLSSLFLILSRVQHNETEAVPVVSLSDTVRL